jgi:alkanesulfonate monooxygenase SsuD/methylene tetrahydromethanopterin reductase-like flavin-dependent oxidoreductase (luciferase family)
MDEDAFARLRAIGADHTGERLTFGKEAGIRPARAEDRSCAKSVAISTLPLPSADRCNYNICICLLFESSTTMDFGYFTLSDNHYPANPRTAERFILDIRDQAIYADQLGMHSVWVGEHHFDSLGVNSRPGTLLASVVPLTKRVRLAPAVSVLPLHHALHVAEEWATLDLISGGRVDFAAGRGYDRREYEPFGANFMESIEIFTEGVEVLLKAWNEPGLWSYKGKYYDIRDMAITPRPIQRPIPFFIACFSRSSMEIAAKKGLNIIFAPFAAAMTFGDLAKAVDAYREECAKLGTAPKKAMCSYFIHIADTPAEEDYGRETLMSYFRHCVLPAFPKDPSKAPPTMQYFMKIVDILNGMRKETLGDKSILLGPPAKIVETLKNVEAAGIEEVILYFNVGNKPHGLVKEQMAKFVETVAPAFRGSHADVRPRIVSSLPR